MITKKLKNNFFNIVIVVMSACFLLLGIYFLQINRLFSKRSYDEYCGRSPSIVHAVGEYNLTFSVDSNFEYFYLNGEPITPGTSAVFQIQAGQFVSFEFGLKEDYRLKQFLSYNTNTSEIFADLSSDGFVMPEFNLTIDITSALQRHITINKIIFENVNSFNIYPSFYTTEYGSNLNLSITADLNYIEYSLNGKKFSSKNNLQNITYEDGFLSITNVQYDDEIDVYFIKKNYTCTISYFEEDMTGTSTGGTFDVLSNDDVFNIQKINNQVVCNVFLNASVTIKDIVSNNGYKFVKVFATDKNGHSEGLGFEITTNTEENTVTVSNVSTDLLIYVQFTKTYEVSVVSNNLYIDGQNKKIGKVGFFNETKDYIIEPRLFDNKSNVTVSTQIDESFDNKYEFKKWNIMTSSGRPLDPEDYGLTENDLSLTEITLINIDRSLKIEAFYGVKSFNVSVVWEGNGTVESVNVIGDTNNVYPVIYGENIIFKLTPKNNMFFIKEAELTKSKPSDNENENAVTKTQKNGYLEFRIDNVLQNLQVNIVFTKNTWWEHIETEELQGKGTEAEPYRIYTASDLAFISKNIYYNISSSDADSMDYSNAYYVLMNDIDCGKDYYFMPIGIVLDHMSQTLKNQFNGTFNYQYHTVTNMWTELDITYYQYEGLFDLLGPNAKIINRYRDYKPLIFGIGGSLILLAIVIRVVFIVEKRRNKPKKIVTLNNYKNHKMDE